LLFHAGKPMCETIETFLLAARHTAETMPHHFDGIGAVLLLSITRPSTVTV
jgi:hypothetical protein